MNVFHKNTSWRDDEAGIEEIADVYESLDYIGKDTAATQANADQERAEIDSRYSGGKAGKLPNKDSEDFQAYQAEQTAASDRLSAELERLHGRYAYTVQSLAGRVALGDMRTAAEVYAASSPDDTHALRRAIRYNAAINYANYAQDPNAQAASYRLAYSKPQDKTDEQPKANYFTIDGTPDTENPGKVWVNPLNPRSAILLGYERNDHPDAKKSLHEPAVATYPVDAYSVKEDGTVLATTGKTFMTVKDPTGKPILVEKPDSGRVITVTPESSMYRMQDTPNGGKVVELFIPEDRRPLMNLTLDNKTVDRMKSSSDGQAMLTAAGVDKPNIIESFEHPDGVNPRPVSVAKTQ